MTEYSAFEQAAIDVSWLLVLLLFVTLLRRGEQYIRSLKI